MSSAILLVLIYIAFVSLGLPDGVLGVAWPVIRPGFGQPVQAAGLITTILTACAALSGFASGAVLQRASAGVVVTASGFMTGLALLGFGFAPSFAVLLALAVPLGLGAGAVDAAMNHFVARHYASRHMNWLHGSWGLGATLGPVIMGAALASAPQDAGAWRQGYLQIGAMQLSLALVFLLGLGLWRRAPERHDDPAASEAMANRRSLNLRHQPVAQWLAPALFFIYAGIEVGISLWAGTVLIEQRHLPVATAGVWVSCFFAAIMGGRFATGLVSARLGNRLLVRLGLLLALTGAALLMTDLERPWLPLAGLVLMGLGCAPVYPALMHEAARRFEPAVAQRVIGRQVGSVYIGCMVLPGALGLIGAGLGLAWIFPCIALLALLLLWLSIVLDRIT